MSRVATCRVGLSADGRLVADTDPSAVSLVAGVGGVVPDEYDDQPLPDEAASVATEAAPAKPRRAPKADAEVTAKATDEAPESA